jgi:hypothetical protein
MIALNDNAPAIAVSCTVLLVLGIFAYTLLLTRRRDVEGILQADDEFLASLQGSQHALALYQEQRGFAGSPRWQVYLAACRELCFYLLGTDQVEKNFATRLRAAGRIMPTQMSAVVRAMRFTSGECVLALQSLAPGSFLSGSLLPFVGLLGTLTIAMSASFRAGPSESNAIHTLAPAALPFVLSILIMLILLPLSRSLERRLKAHEARLQLFPLSFANALERVFVDHRQTMDHLPSVGELGIPDRPNLSLPPTSFGRGAL